MGEVSDREMRADERGMDLGRGTSGFCGFGRMTLTGRATFGASAARPAGSLQRASTAGGHGQYDITVVQMTGAIGGASLLRGRRATHSNSSGWSMNFVGSCGGSLKRSRKRACACR